MNLNGISNTNFNHALVVVNAPHNEKEEIIDVLGGNIKQRFEKHTTRSVSLLNSDGSEYKRQPRGPRMNQWRVGLAGVFCNGYVYAIGGWDRDSMERIRVSDLLSSDHLSKTEKKTPWKTLKCRLSTTQRGSCSATAVQNRYIVIGGADQRGNVDILDISQARQPFIFHGPPLTFPRTQFGLAAIGSRVYVIGGYKMTGGEEQSTPVEYLDLLTDSGNDRREFQESTRASNLSWKMHKDLVLSVPRVGHSVVRVGSCLGIIGGHRNHGFSVENGADDSVHSVEVFDTKHNKVWSLPDLWEARGSELSAVSVLNGIVILGCDMRCKIIARLPLMDKNLAVYKRLLDGPLLSAFD